MWRFESISMIIIWFVRSNELCEDFAMNYYAVLVYWTFFACFSSWRHTHSNWLRINAVKYCVRQFIWNWKVCVGLRRRGRYLVSAFRQRVTAHWSWINRMCSKIKSTLELMDHACGGTYEGCEFLIKLELSVLCFAVPPSTSFAPCAPSLFWCGIFSILNFHYILADFVCAFFVVVEFCFSFH